MLHYLDKIYFSYNESPPLNQLDQHHSKYLFSGLEDQIQSLKRTLANVGMSKKVAEIFKKRGPILLLISLCWLPVGCFVPDDLETIAAESTIYPPPPPAPGVSLSKTTASVSETLTTDSFTIKLDSEPESNVVINLSDNDTGEATISASTLTFTSSNWSAVQTVTITGVDDDFADGSQTVFITISVDNSSDATYTALDNQTVTVTNMDAGESLGFTSKETNSSTSVTESGGTDNLSIVLTSEPLANVVLSITSTDTGEATISPSSLTFTASDWSTPQEVTITAVEDNIIDGVRWSGVTVSISSSVDASYAALGSQSITATINDSRTGRQQDSLISAGLKYYIAVDNTTGTVYAWGDDTCAGDNYGKCDTNLSNSASVTVGSGPIYPRISDTAPDNTTHLGDNSTSTPIAMPSVIPTSPFQVQTKRNTNCVMNSTRDNVTCWGRINYDNGFGIMNSSSIWRLSHSAGAFYDLVIHREGGCALNSDRTVSCWGYGQYGAYGDGTEGFTAGLKTPSITNVVDLAAGQDHLCAVVDNGTAWCWGRDNSNQLGDNAPNTGGVTGGAGSSLPVAVSGGISNFIQIEAYSQTTCALTDNGTVWCWGANSNGQLGEGTTTSRDYPVQVQNITDALDIYVGDGTACAAVNKRLDLKCWGNYYLGDGSTAASSTPVTVTETNGWGSTYTFDDVAIGQSSACAYNEENNQVYCWGVNADGQLGLGNTSTPYSPMQNTGSPF